MKTNKPKGLVKTVIIIAIATVSTIGVSILKNNEAKAQPITTNKYLASDFNCYGGSGCLPPVDVKGQK